MSSGVRFTKQVNFVHDECRGQRAAAASWDLKIPLAPITWFSYPMVMFTYFCFLGLMANRVWSWLESHSTNCWRNAMGVLVPSWGCLDSSCCCFWAGATSRTSLTTVTPVRNELRLSIEGAWGVVMHICWCWVPWHRWTCWVSLVHIRVKTIHWSFPKLFTLLVLQCLCTVCSPVATPTQQHSYCH